MYPQHNVFTALFNNAFHLPIGRFISDDSDFIPRSFQLGFALSVKLQRLHGERVAQGVIRSTQMQIGNHARKNRSRNRPFFETYLMVRSSPPIRKVALATGGAKAAAGPAGTCRLRALHLAST